MPFVYWINHDVILIRQYFNKAKLILKVNIDVTKQDINIEVIAPYCIATFNNYSF